MRCSAGPWCEPAKSGYTTIACVAPDPGAWAFALSSLVNGLSTAIVDPLKEHLLTDESATRAVTAMPVTEDHSKPAEVADAAKSAATDVASTAAAGAKDAANEVVTQVKDVAGEAKRQAGTVIDQTRRELSQQADERARQAAGGLRTLADQVSALADGRPADAGALVGYLGDAQTRVSSMAERLETAGPQGLLSDVSDFARRRPIIFLAAAAGVGFMVGRLARAGHAAQQDSGSNSPTTVPPAVPSAMPAPGALPSAPVGNGPLVSTSP